MWADSGMSRAMENRRCSRAGYTSLLLFTLVFAVLVTSVGSYAGGVHFGFGVDVPLPGAAVPPPVVVSPPAVVVERTPLPPPIVVEQAPVVIKRTPPTIVYEEPVIVERRSTVYYYPRSYEYRPHREEVEREYYRQRTRSWEDDEQY